MFFSAESDKMLWFSFVINTMLWCNVEGGLCFLKPVIVHAMFLFDFVSKISISSIFSFTNILVTSTCIVSNKAIF